MGCNSIDDSGQQGQEEFAQSGSGSVSFPEQTPIAGPEQTLFLFRVLHLRAMISQIINAPNELMQPPKISVVKVKA